MAPPGQRAPNARHLAYAPLMPLAGRGSIQAAAPAPAGITARHAPDTSAQVRRHAPTRAPQDVTGGILIDTDEVALAGRAGLQ